MSDKQLAENLGNVIKQLSDAFPKNFSESELSILYEDLKQFFIDNKLDIISISELAEAEKTLLLSELKILIQLLISLRSYKGVSLETINHQVAVLLSKKKSSNSTKIINKVPVPNFVIKPVRKTMRQLDQANPAINNNVSTSD